MKAPFGLSFVPPLTGRAFGLGLFFAAAPIGAARFKSTSRITRPASSPMLRNAIPIASPLLLFAMSSKVGAAMSEKRELSSEKSDMHELAWASEQLRLIAPMGAVKGRIRDAAARLKWRYSRARDVWYADPRVSLKAREVRDIETVAGIAYGRSEIRTTEQLIARADALLMGSDPDFSGAFVTAFRAFVGALDRTRTGRTD